MKPANQLTFCISCEEAIDREPSYEDYAGAATENHLRDAMQVRCRECAEEILGYSIPELDPLMYGAGGGRRVIHETKTH